MESTTRDDILRSALVMAVAAVDSYVHRFIQCHFSKVREGELPKSLRKQMVPLSDLVHLAEKVVEARKKKRNLRPWVLVKKSLARQLQERTFQSAEQVEQGLSLLGVKSVWEGVCKSLSEKPEEVKKRLNKIVLRRNQVVHEGDVQRQSRPHKLRLNPVDSCAVRDDVDWIGTLIAAMDKQLPKLLGSVASSVQQEQE